MVTRRNDRDKEMKQHMIENERTGWFDVMKQI